MNSSDIFRQAIPSFGLKGKTTINTSLGGAMTLICGVIILIYAATKMSLLQSVRGQTISFYYDYHDTSPENRLNLNERNFKIAFSFEDYLTRKLKNDPRYVRWILRILRFEGNQYYEKLLPFHECTDEEYDSFYPISSHHKSEVKNIRDDPERGLLCIDWDD